MNEQLSILPEIEQKECEYPLHSAASGFRYGCRCQRCMAWKRGGGVLPPTCHIEGCTNLRLKHRRYCEEHPPEKKATTRVALEAICEIPGCDRRITWYESTLRNNREEIRDLYRRVCEPHRRPYMGVIKSHHLNAQQALGLLLVTRCSYCGEELVTLSNGRKDVVVDHDHSCCETSSCGRCVRGFVHPQCNMTIGFLETVERSEVGLERAMEYLVHYRERNRLATLQPV